MAVASCAFIEPVPNTDRNLYRKGYRCGDEFITANEDINAIYNNNTAVAAKYHPVFLSEFFVQTNVALTKGMIRRRRMTCLMAAVRGDALEVVKGYLRSDEFTNYHVRQSSWRCVTAGAVLYRRPRLLNWIFAELGSDAVEVDVAKLYMFVAACVGENIDALDTLTSLKPELLSDIHYVERHAAYMNSKKLAAWLITHGDVKKKASVWFRFAFQYDSVEFVKLLLQAFSVTFELPPTDGMTPCRLGASPVMATLRICLWHSRCRNRWGYALKAGASKQLKPNLAEFFTGYFKM